MNSVSSWHARSAVSVAGLFYFISELQHNIILSQSTPVYRHSLNEKCVTNYRSVSAPYGIFARNCVAMAKDAKSTFQIIDENG